MTPRKPDSEAYMRGWFLVKFKGDAKAARIAARRFVAEHKGMKA